ncbi:MAG: hypothetical protein IJ629_05330 [Clostridia bacterium]|nr:hypothetical protein [Clostridia bacterium]
MSDKKKDYFVPEQLDDNDFEKEKKEAKKARKEKKFELNRKQIIKIVSIIVVVALIIAGVYLYLNPVPKKSTAPEQTAKTFCTYFNNGRWSKLNELMDFKGYYVLGAVLEEADYTQFDKAYQKVDEKDETYSKYISSIKYLINLDEDALSSFADIQIRLNSIEACNLIQGTETLYKLRVNFDYIYDGQAENVTEAIYISNASGEYKVVFGEWMQTVLNYYQSVYMIQANYGY